MKHKTPTAEELKFAILAVDVALLTVKDGVLLLREVAVNRPPYFPNTKGLPGGLVGPKETAEEAALRLITEKAGLTSALPYLEQLYTFSAVDRDPRGRVVAVTYTALVPWEALSITEQLPTADHWWCVMNESRNLAYDHDSVAATALSRLRARARYTTIISKLMPHEFTLTELEQVYESILCTDLDKRNFRKKILKLGILTPLGKKRSGGAFRPAELYRFTSKKVTEIEVL